MKRMTEAEAVKYCYDNKIVINTKTRNEFDCLLYLFDRNNCFWIGGRELSTRYDWWRCYNVYTCICVIDYDTKYTLNMSPKHYWENKGWNLITFEEFYDMIE